MLLRPSLRLAAFGLVGFVAGACVTVAPPSATTTAPATALATPAGAASPTSVVPASAAIGTPTPGSTSAVATPPLATPTVSAAPTESPIQTAPATPAGPVVLVNGTASVTVAGAANETFELSATQVGTYTPGVTSDVVQAAWANADSSRLLRMTIDVDSVGEVPTGAAFMAIGLGGQSIEDDTTYFPDAFRSACRITLTQLDASGVAGSFSCDDLESVDGSRKIDAQGVFAAAAAAASPSPVVLVPPGSPMSFTSGTAQATSTGDVAKTITVAVSATSIGTWTPDTGQLELRYTDAAGDTVLVRLEVASNVTDQFIGLGLPGSTIDDATYFPDGGHTQCTATLSRFDATGLEGSFSCAHLPNSTGDMTIDASGSFSAAP